MDTKAQIRSFLVTNFYVQDPSSLADDSSLLDLGLIDSTGVLEVIDYLETTFAITVEDSEMLPENLDSIDRLAAFVRRKKGLKTPLS